MLGYLDLVMVYFMGKYLFDVPFRGSLLLMFFVSGIFLVGALSLGFLISVTATTQFFATRLALHSTLFAAFLLSGFVFPISDMPQLFQAITCIISARLHPRIKRHIPQGGRNRGNYFSCSYVGYFWCCRDSRCNEEAGETHRMNQEKDNSSPKMATLFLRRESIPEGHVGRHRLCGISCVKNSLI